MPSKSNRADNTKNSLLASVTAFPLTGIVDSGFGASQDVMEFIGDTDVNVADQSAPSAPIIVKKPCMLKKQEERHRKEYEEDEAAGLHDPNYQCECCRVGNSDKTDDTAEELHNIYNIEKQLFLTQNDDEISDLMSKRYNKNIHTKDSRLGNKNGLKQWTKSTVRHHIKKCASTPRRTIWNRIRAIDDAVEHIEKHGLYEREYTVDEYGEEHPVDAPEKINPQMHKMWLSLIKTEIELIKTDFSIKQQEMKDLRADSQTTDRSFLVAVRKNTNPYD